jgi:hypothetical protein
LPLSWRAILSISLYPLDVGKASTVSFKMKVAATPESAP